MAHHRIVGLREVQYSIKDSVKQLVEDKIHERGLSHLFKITESEIIGPYDSLMIFRGLKNHTVTSIKSLEGFDRAFIEEAQAVSQKSIDILEPTIREKGSQLWWAWNPISPDDPVDKMFREHEGDPDFICVESNHYNNPFFPEALEASMKRDKIHNYEKYLHVWEGHYQTQSEAQVFRNWRVDQFEAPEGTIFYFGADWGFSIDPSVLVRCFIIGRTIFIDHEAYAVGCPIDKTPFLFAGTQNMRVNSANVEALQQLSAAEKRDWQGIPEAAEFTIRADSARPETIAYMKQHGFPKMVPALKGSGSVEDGIEFLQSYDVVIHPRCVHTIREWTSYSYKIDPHTGEVTNVLSEKENHVVDAARYALESVRRSHKATSRELAI